MVHKNYNSPEGISVGQRPASVEQLLEDAALEQLGIGEILQFEAGEHDVYNITAPFQVGQQSYIAGRVESHNSWYDTDVYDPQIWFFEEDNNVWRKVPSLPVFEMEDPFLARIGEQIVFGGVKVNGRNLTHDFSLRTHFYIGRDLTSLIALTHGPEGMKDIRLVELADGKIGVFTRPQGARSKLGKIGFIVIDSLAELTPTLLDSAPVIESLFVDNEEWGGVNNAYQMSDGRIGALGHIARTHDGQHEYYPLTFLFNPDTYEVSNEKIIASYGNFPKAKAKFPRLERVVFPGGLLFKKDGLAELYCGVADAHGARLAMPNPFGPLRPLEFANS